MEYDAINFVDSDSFLVALQPFYGLLREELLIKIKYLNQVLFWSCISTKYRLECLINEHMDNLLYDRYWAHPQEADSITLKESFETLLNKHEITFVPVNTLSEVCFGCSVGIVDSHLCSDNNGKWGALAGFGLKFFSSQMERAKYIGLINEIYHSRLERLDDAHFLINPQNNEEEDPIEVLNILRNGFKEKFAFFDKLVVCCKNSQNDEISKLRSVVDTLEYRIFWTRVNNFEISLTTMISKHKLTYSKRNLKHIVAKNKDLWVEWRIEFERLVSSYDLIFGPGKALSCTIEENKTYLSRERIHLCSGKNGSWDEARGFGRLMLTDRSARKNYLKLVKYIQEYCS